jgi:predicted DNA binding protein
MITMEKGYFDNPKKIDVRSLATLLGIPPAALSEIIRAAQLRIFRKYLEKV